MFPHHRNDQRVIAEESKFNAEFRRMDDIRKCHRQNLDAELGYALNRRSEAMKPTNFIRMSPKPPSDALPRPLIETARVNGHQTMGHIAHLLRGREPAKFAALRAPTGRDTAFRIEGAVRSHR